MSESKKPRIFGYARISRPTQDLARQVRNIKDAYPTASVWKEAKTGTKLAGRTILQQLLASVQPGDTIVFDDVDRMSRNAEEGIALYLDLYKKGVELVFLKAPTINTAVYREELQVTMPRTGTDVDLFLQAAEEYMRRLATRQIKIAFDTAQAEVDKLHKRTSEGRKTAILNGKQPGVKPGQKLHTKKERLSKAIILQHCHTYGGTLTDKECMKLCGVTEGTYFKYKREMRAQAEANGGTLVLETIDTKELTEHEKEILNDPSSA